MHKLLPNYDQKEVNNPAQIAEKVNELVDEVNYLSKAIRGLAGVFESYLKTIKE